MLLLLPSTYNACNGHYLTLWLLNICNNLIHREQTQQGKMSCYFQSLISTTIMNQNCFEKAPYCIKKRY